MKVFEVIYRFCEPGLPVIYKRVRKTLTSLAKACTYRPRFLDIGGRKSHYTIGVPADITITDLPRTNSIQHRLHLGINQEIAHSIRVKRSNVESVLIDDMTRSTLSSASFDCAVAVEVLEHVDDDARFLREVKRVLKPEGVFLMTTPNGDFVRNINPDHKRHYRRNELAALLRREFDSVEVRYASPGTKSYNLALRSWSPSRPLRTILTYAGGVINSLEDRFAPQTSDGVGMQELIAVARKSRSV
jgi:SAM-dependent methyltransferase